MTGPSPSPPVATALRSVWCLTDHKPGHRRQIEGLVGALAQRVPVQEHWIHTTLEGKRSSRWTRRSLPTEAGRELPDPDLIIGAGHSTHLPALAARRARGGKAIMLMRPTLPTALFDLCLVPEHDLLSFFGRLNRLRVVPTRGVLNPFHRSDESDPARGLILIGGPSRHHGWSGDGMLEQLQQLRCLSPSSVRWTLTTSRRTPPGFQKCLRDWVSADQHRQTVEFVPFAETGGDWLPRQLKLSQTVFVSEDSVSMIYESLTVGADVGVLSVPRLRRRSRNALCVDRLLADRLIVSFSDWCAERFEKRIRAPFNEASRCAGIVCDRLLDAA